MTVIMMIVWVVCMSQRSRFGYLYTSEDAVAELAADVLPVYLTYQTCSCVNFTFKGRLDGCGRQMAFAKVSMMAWYLVGIPVAAATVFWFEWGVVGLWGGMTFGACVHIMRHADLLLLLLLLLWVLTPSYCLFSTYRESGLGNRHGSSRPRPGLGGRDAQGAGARSLKGESARCKALTTERGGGGGGRLQLAGWSYLTVRLPRCSCDC